MSFKPPSFSALLRRHKRLLLAATILSSLVFFFAPVAQNPYKVLDAFAPGSNGALVPQPDPTDNLPRLPQHQPIPGGRLKVTLGGAHPLYALIAEAEAKWNNMVKSQSTTYDGAVKEYQRRYGRKPPRGFDKWYQFAQSVDFKLVDEFDQINRDIGPLLALPDSIMKQRMDAVTKETHCYHLTIDKGKATAGGPLIHWELPGELQKLVSGFAKDLPDMRIYVSGHDGGPSVLGEDMRLAVDTVLKRGQRLTEQEVTELQNMERNPRHGTTNACLQDPVTSFPNQLPEQNKHAHTFISDHRTSMSFCENPAILNNPPKRHGYFAYDIARQNIAVPYFVQSQLSAGGSLLHPALQSFVSPAEYIRRYGEIAPWSNRTNKVFWRGRTTGEWFNHVHNWRYSHRIRLHLLTNPNGTLIDPQVPSEVELLVDGGPQQGVRLERFPRDLLNEKYMDVTLIGPKTVQCDETETDHTCRDMDSVLKWGKETGWHAGLDSKYLLDVDGNGWSSRFQRLLSSGAVIFKMTVFPEWNSDWLIPYYHYVPIQVDYSDLYDSIAFFAGVPGGPPGQDKLAEKIGMHSHEFAVNHWRWEDMQVYMYRLMLEYTRAVSDDRDAMSMP